MMIFDFDIRQPEKLTAAKLLAEKQTWSGAELGSIEIENALVSSYHLANDEPATPADIPDNAFELLISVKDLKKLVDLLPEHELQIYSKYISLHDFLNLSSVNIDVIERNCTALLTEYSRYVQYALQVETLCRGLRLSGCDDTGLFRLPDTTLDYAFLPTFSKIAPDKEDRERVKTLRHIFMKDYSALYCYNMILEIINSCHNIPHIYIIHRATNIKHSAFELLNNQIKELRALIEENLINGWHPKAQELKLQLLDEYFPLIEYQINIPPENIEHVTALIKEMALFNKQHRGQALDILLYYLRQNTQYQ